MVLLLLPALGNREIYINITPIRTFSFINTQTLEGANKKCEGLQTPFSTSPETNIDATRRHTSNLRNGRSRPSRDAHQYAQQHEPYTATRSIRQRPGIFADSTFGLRTLANILPLPHAPVRTSSQNPLPLPATTINCPNKRPCLDLWSFIRSLSHIQHL